MEKDLKSLRSNAIDNIRGSLLCIPFIDLYFKSGEQHHSKMTV